MPSGPVDWRTDITFTRQHPVGATRRHEFDGRYTVWIGFTIFGVVRKSADPLPGAGRWGYEMRPTLRYPHGVTCDGGFRTRQAAAEALVTHYNTGQPA